jgi:alkaline phosphatase
LHGYGGAGEASVDAGPCERALDDPALGLDGLRALVRTASADGSTTDSAAAATAYATGVKISNGAVAVDVDGFPLVSILDLASEAGKATGIVSTAAVTDATPAAFAASAAERGDQLGIAQQYVDNGDLDVILGGGRADFTGDADGDGATTLAEAQAAGFAYVATRGKLLANESDRLLGLFAEGSLGAPIGNGEPGRRPSGEPILAEMTEAALAHLSRDDDGFFLLVEEEGSDTWGHSNDGATVMNAARSYEDAVQVARGFADANPGTLIISVADHETGGMTLPLEGGRTPEVFRSFTTTYAEMLVAIEEAAADLGPDPSPNLILAAVNEVVSDATGGAAALTAEEAAAVLDAPTPRASQEALSAALNARGGIGYATQGHTPADVPLYAFGSGAELRGGVIENTTVAEWIAEAMGLPLPVGGLRAVSGTVGDDLLTGTARNDATTAGPGDDRLLGGAGHDRLRGNGGDDRLMGGAGDDVLLGGAGRDRLRGGVGNDLQEGGAGSDVFVFRGNFGVDSVASFVLSEDKMRLQARHFADLDAVIAASRQSGDGVVIALGNGNEIRVEDLDMEVLHHVDFVFA